MLVYKTTENNETKFYGVQNNEFFAGELISNFDKADNAGLINAEYLDNERVNKLTNLAVEKITTMRQAFEVYSIINDQSLKDTRNDFRFVMEVYSDNKPKTFYRVATLSDFKEVMFDEYNLGTLNWGEALNLMYWLRDNVEGFDFNVINGYSQGESTIFYKFGSNNDAYLPLDDEVLTCIYGGVVDIEELEKDEQGYPLTEGNGEILEMVPSLYIDAGSDVYVNEYMEEHYNAVPAEKKVIYY